MPQSHDNKQNPSRRRRLQLHSIFLFLTMLGLSQFSFAANEASAPENVLYRIRERLLGDWPTAKEWDELEKIQQTTGCRQASCLTNFYRTKIREYMKDPRFISRYQNKIEEMIHLKSAVAPWHETGPKLESNAPHDPKDLKSKEYENYNALNSLIRKILAENLSWNQLFLANQYTVYNVPLMSSIDYTDQPFFGLPSPQFSFSATTGNDKPVATAVDLSGNPNAAGVYSTSRFLNKFFNNNVNQNRKRASAYFRIMMCDSLRPSIERKDQDKIENQISLGITEAEFNKVHDSKMLAAKHANSPDCRKCHQRLDPVAWTFRSLEVQLSKEPSPGYLRYYDDQGELTKMKVNGIRHLVEKTVEQDRYLYCQVDRFYQWIVGYDVLVPMKRKQELAEAFTKVQGRVQDYIEYLLLTPEFATGHSENLQIPQSLKRARSEVFKNCNECHASLPFGSNPFLSKDIVTKIVYALDLPHDGKNRFMPPQSHYWAPSDEELKLVSQWIREGAPRDTGEKLFAPEEIEIMWESQK